MSKNTKAKTAEEIIAEAIAEDLVESVEVEEVEEAPVEEVVIVKSSNSYVAEEGDTYAALGKAFARDGETAFQAAQRIMAANGGKALVPGSEVAL